MNNDDKLFELMSKMYGEMQEGFKEVNKRIDDTESEINSIKKIVIKIENDHGRKLDALFDGYKQNSDKLDRIEQEVARHEEFIIKRVK